MTLNSTASDRSLKQVLFRHNNSLLISRSDSVVDCVPNNNDYVSARRRLLVCSVYSLTHKGQGLGDKRVHEGKDEIEVELLRWQAQSHFSSLKLQLIQEVSARQLAEIAFSVSEVCS